MFFCKWHFKMQFNLNLNPSGVINLFQSLTAINSHVCLFYRWVWNPTACGQFSYHLSVMVGRAFSRFKLQTCETSSTSTNESKIFISSVHPETGWTPCSSSVSNSSHSALVTAVNSEQLPLNVYLDSDFLEEEYIFCKNNDLREGLYCLYCFVHFWLLFRCV